MDELSFSVEERQSHRYTQWKLHLRGPWAGLFPPFSTQARALLWDLFTDYAPLPASATGWDGLPIASIERFLFNLSVAKGTDAVWTHCEGIEARLRRFLASEVRVKTRNYTLKEEKDATSEDKDD